MTDVVYEFEQPTPLITDVMIGHDNQSETLQKEYQKKWHVPWKSVQDAIDQGYIYAGWNLMDYIRATDKGNPNLPHPPCPMCRRPVTTFYNKQIEGSQIAGICSQHGEVPVTPRKPFEYVDIWGVQGASKSAFSLQLLRMLYGDWNLSVERMLLERDMLIAAYEEVPEPNQRIPAGCLDDLNTIISKQEWFVDKDFYILFHKFLNTIRTKFGTLLSTLPNVGFTPEMLGDVVTFEVIIYPNSTYKVERYCWDIDPFRAVTPKFTKIVVESAKFDIYQTPPQVWTSYQQKRVEVANKLFTAMKDYMQSGGKQAAEADKILKKRLKEVPQTTIIEKLRAQGYKIDQEKTMKALALYKEEMLAKLPE